MLMIECLLAIFTSSARKLWLLLAKGIRSERKQLGSCAHFEGEKKKEKKVEKFRERKINQVPRSCLF